VTCSSIASADFSTKVRPELRPSAPDRDLINLRERAHIEERMLRDVIETDLPIFYEHQLDPESTRMAAFPPRKEWTAFLAHWRTKVLGDPASRAQTIVWNERVAGNIVSWPQDERRMIAYWIGREYWGRGIATTALAEFLGYDRARPLHAFVVAHNVGSIRVLEKCGFVRIGATSAPDGVDEYLYRFGQA
jgi:RimJ/RimL family protein N-acetyltransferase